MPPKSRIDTFEDTEVFSRWRGLASSTPNAGNLQGTYTHWAKGTNSLTDSTGHPFHKLGKTRANIGGNFSVVRREYSESSPYVHNRTVVGDGNASASNYKGKYFAETGLVVDADFPIVPPHSDFDLDAMGTQAISATIPTNPIGGLAVTLGELRREGIPSLVGALTWKDRTFRAKQAGSEYLNVQFGWLPLVDEILTMADTVKRSDEITRQYEAEEGKLLHRAYTFPSTSSTSTTVTSAYPTPAWVVGFWNSQGTKTTVTTEKVESWFEGAYTYTLPPRGSFARSAAIANKLYGTRLTPDVVWNLTPWSWAVDWFSNVGTVVSNQTAFANDGLVMPYGYIMRRRTVTRTVTNSGSRMRRDNQVVNCRQTFTTTVKQRRMATPYGFGLDPLGFTGRQWSILAALGLSKGSSGMKYE